MRKQNHDGSQKWKITTRKKNAELEILEKNDLGTVGGNDQGWVLGAPDGQDEGEEGGVVPHLLEGGVPVLQSGFC